MTRKQLLPVLGLLAGLAWFPEPAHAQYPYPYPWPQWQSRAGSYLQGNASMLDSAGNFMVNQEQARIMNQQAQQAKLVTKKQAFEQAQWEKANTPTFTEEQIPIQNRIVFRMVTNPQEWEIVGGVTLNRLLPFINTLAAKGIMGPTVPLDSIHVSRLNVTAGSQGPNVGLFRTGEALEWPLVLQGPEQEKLDGMIGKALAELMKGKLTPKTFKPIVPAIDDLRATNKKRWLGEEIDAQTYLEGNRFLTRVETAAKSLTQPGASKFLAGSLHASGSSVPELAFHMSQQGLQFGPANPGDEPAYHAVHNAVVSYITAAQAHSGFQLRLRTPKPQPGAKF